MNNSAVDVSMKFVEAMLPSLPILPSSPLFLPSLLLFLPICSSTELFPEDWLPITTIWGKSRGCFPMAAKTSCNLLTIGMSCCIPRSCNKEEEEEDEEEVEVEEEEEGGVAAPPAAMCV